MPIYEYECRSCGHRFEKLEHFDSAPRKKCPVCGARADRTLPSNVGFIFKGSGFYATDYGQKKANKEAEAENEKKKLPEGEEK